MDDLKELYFYRHDGERMKCSNQGCSDNKDGYCEWLCKGEQDNCNAYISDEEPSKAKIANTLSRFDGGVHTSSAVRFPSNSRRKKRIKKCVNGKYIKKVIWL